MFQISALQEGGGKPGEKSSGKITLTPAMAEMVAKKKAETEAAKAKADAERIAAAAQTAATQAVKDSSVKPPPVATQPPKQKKTVQIPKAIRAAAAPKPAATTTGTIATTTTAGPTQPATYKDQLIEFYEMRNEDPEHFVYTPTGDLVELDDSGKPVAGSTIPLRPFRSLTKDEVVRLMEERKQKINQCEVPTAKPADLQESKGEPEDEMDCTKNPSFVEALNTFREVYSKYKQTPPAASKSDVVNATKEVMLAEKRRNIAMYPQKFITVYESVPIKKILLDSKDDRKLPYDIFAMGNYLFKKEDAFGHYISQEELDRMATVSKMKGGRSYDVIIIESYEDPERGFLHPAYVKDFSFVSTQYSSVYQAFEAERLKMLKNFPLVEQLMKTRSPRTIHSVASQDKTPIPNAYDLWVRVLKTFYQQNTELGKKLLETGSSLFTMRDSTISSPSDYLNALMSVRTMIAENEEGGAPAPVENRVITEEEQKKARTGAIIYNRKFGGGAH